MMNNIRIIMFFLVFCQMAMAQYPAILKGQVYVDGGNPENVLVANLSIQKSVVTNSDGTFSIMASPEDLIVFSGMQIAYFRKLLDESDFNQPLIISLKPEIKEIEVVEIFNSKGLDAVSLGILQKPAKIYTQAERHLYTATDLNAQANAGNFAGGSLSLDPLLNWISGRTKMLKNNLSIERRLAASKKIKNLLEEEFFTQTLAIPKDQIDAFLIYATESSSVIEQSKQNNKFMLQFTLVSVAREFNNLQTKN